MALSTAGSQAEGEAPCHIMNANNGVCGGTGNGTDNGDGRQRQRQQRLRLIEFFSGIGGFRLGVERAVRRINKRSSRSRHDATPNACKGTGGSAAACSTCTCSIPLQITLEACHAYEISLHANDTYRHNFHQSRPSNHDDDFTVTTKLIEQLPTSAIAAHNANIWTMSPPCQPFTSTTNAKRLDGRDPRTAGFRAVLRLLDDLSPDRRPEWIVLENVKGFVGSDVLSELYDCLERNAYGWNEYLLSPMQFGMPNHRKRYYLVAQRNGTGKRLGCDRDGESIREMLPRTCTCACVEERGEIPVQVRKRPLSEYIDSLMTIEELSPFLVPDEILTKPWAQSLPIVSANDAMSHCFTAAYGRVVHRATGALLLMDPDHPSVEDHPELIDREDMSKLSGRLRKFTPGELLRIFGYPEPFGFPDNISLEHRYKLIGNSVNVEVVSKVVETLFSL